MKKTTVKSHNNSSLKKTGRSASTGKFETPAQHDTMRDEKLSQFFRENGLPNLASLIDDLDRLPVK